MRAEAVRLFRAGVEAADPARAVARELAARPLPAAGPGGRIVAIAAGKAARAMMAAALDALGPVPGALVVTNHENARPLAGAEVIDAGHPVPDAAGARAAERVLAAVSTLTPADRVLVLISGGASALLPAPVEGVRLEEKAEVNRLLLASGADITEMNLVRQALSRIKGGGLARAAWPAPVTALILSDVIGDDLRVVASGPTCPAIGTRAEAAAALKARGLWERLPESVRRVLTELPDPPPPPPADNRLVGSNAMSLAAMGKAAGVTPEAEPLTGDVAQAAARVVASLSGPGIRLFGGETTVVVRGPGLGGRNQELALRVAILAEGAGWRRPWVFLSGGTDGRDGPTDAAGGLVDAGTLARIRAAGRDPLADLARNDSHHALKVAGDLLITGPTGTNVADLQVLIRA